MVETKAKAAQSKADQGKKAKAQTMADILAAKKPNTRTIDIILDSDLAKELQLKTLELEQMKQRSKGKKSLAEGTQSLESEIDALFEKAADSAATFTFQDIGRQAFDALLAAHRPTKEQKTITADQGGGILEYNTDTFPPALMAASATDPEMTLEEAEEIYHNWSSGDAEILFTTAILVCKERASLPLSWNGTGPTSNSS